jgi:hypothetical protein
LAAFRSDGPEDIDEIFSAELIGIVETFEFGVDGQAAVFAFDPGFAFRSRRQLGSLEVYFRGTAGPIVHRLNGTGNIDVNDGAGLLSRQVRSGREKHGTKRDGSG